MKWFRSLSQTCRYMLFGIAGFFAAALILGLVAIGIWGPWNSPLGLRPIPFSIGLLAGCLTSMYKVVSMETTLSRSIDMESDKAKPYGQLQYFIRFIVTGVLVVLVVFLPNIFGMLGTVLGILSMPVGAYAAHFMLKIKGFEKEEK